MKQKLFAVLGLIMAFAASATPISIYLRHDSPWGSDTYIYTWSGSSKPSGAWPGERLSFTNIGVIVDGVEYWKYDIPENYTSINVIFNNGGSSQTANLEGITETSFLTISESRDSSSKRIIEVLPNPLTAAPAEDNPYVYFAAPTDVNQVEIYATQDGYVPVEGGEKVSGQPDVLYILGTLPDHKWDTSYAVPFTRYGSCFVLESVTLNASSETNPGAFFSFATKLDPEGTTNWSGVNSSDRYGSSSSNATVTVDTPIKYKAYTGSSASSCSSWTVDPGTYRIVVDFAAGTVLLASTTTPDLWQQMLPVTAENDGVELPGYNLFRIPATEAASVGFRYGDTTAVGGTLASGRSFILVDDAWLECPPVAVEFSGADKGVHSGSTLAIASAWAAAAEYTVDGLTTEIVDGEAEIDLSNTEANSLVAVDWVAVNSAGLHFCGSESFINAPEDAPVVKIYAVCPSNWQGVAYSIVSDLSHEYTSEGVFETVEGKYLVLTVPTHLIHSTILLSDTASSEAASAARRAKAAGESVEVKLAGQSMYFDNDGEHWASTEYSGKSGISSVEADSEAPVYYNLQGIRVDAPAAGIYIERRGASARKVQF